MSKSVNSIRRDLKRVKYSADVACLGLEVLLLDLDSITGSESLAVCIKALRTIAHAALAAGPGWAPAIAKRALKSIGEPLVADGNPGSRRDRKGKKP